MDVRAKYLSFKLFWWIKKTLMQKRYGASSNLTQRNYQRIGFSLNFGSILQIRWMEERSKYMLYLFFKKLWFIKDARAAVLTTYHVYLDCQQKMSL